MSIKTIETGHTLQLERILFKGGRFEIVEVPSNSFLIEHSGRLILFDTGYSERFMEETKKYPYSIYGNITPVKEIVSVKEKLIENNILPQDISIVIISHYHADHICGLKDFQKANFISTKEAYDSIKNLNGWTALKKGFLPGLIPPDFEQRISFFDKKISLQKEYHPFTEGYDILGDNTLIGINLPGHAQGQIGLLLDKTFIIADSCWRKENYIEHKLPSQITRFIHHNWHDYVQTVKNISSLNETNPLNILLTHERP